ncbi:lipocalin family protein [Shewanella litorisediminis]|uniref:Outer membrane lipoprotein Blc n=1 Tax=Shewanella litorisediminis TaxID=1173586 RepID=A0ABX7FZ69_9GAMM|nr:lipocalin family protein [Shewanella litorisediminis]MCL2918709.1 lipocalin family protein [Shewanella litorisediminis]QRH00318.1 lipocalin family protein [Shewanella litorisediminis]
MNWRPLLIGSIMIYLLTACSSQRLPVIQDFEVKQYLGTWHEIARMENRFEKGLSRVTAEYRQEDDHIKVINRGYSEAEQRWKEAVGKARFEGASDEGRLEVSFFGPFYGDYQILAASRYEDGQYRTALVSGNTFDYLWLLSRQPTLTEEERRLFTDKIRALGVNPDTLVWLDGSATQ